MKLIYAVLIVLGNSGAVFADQVNDCYKKAKTTNASELCAAAEADAIGVKLKNVLQFTLENTDAPEATRALSDAQVAWNAFREQDCHALSLSYGSGTYRGTAFQECMVDHAIQRIKDLKSWNPSHWSVQATQAN